VRATTYGGASPNVNNSFYSANPSGVTATSTLAGIQSITNSVFSSTDISVTFDQSRTGASGTYASGYNVTYFQATGNDAYTISGNYSLSSDYGYFESRLFDVTANVYVYYNWLQSEGNQAVTLGQTTGSYNNLLIGSLTGNLIAGHNYWWYTEAVTQARPTADSGATATGSARLLIGDLNAIPTPEPASLAIWGGLGCMGLLAARRRRAKVVIAV
jgi:hypothetical protein